MKIVKTKESFEEISKRASLYLEADQRRLGVWCRRVFVIDGQNLFAYKKKGNDGSINGWPLLGGIVRVRHKYTDWNERAFVLTISLPHVYNLTIAFDSLYEQAKFLKTLSSSGCTIMGAEAMMLISKLQDFQNSKTTAHKKISEELDCRPKSANLVPKLSIRMVNINWKFGSQESDLSGALKRKSSSDSSINHTEWIGPLSCDDSIITGSTADGVFESEENGISSSHEDLQRCNSKSEDNILVIDGIDESPMSKDYFKDDSSNNNIITSSESDIFLRCNDYKPLDGKNDSKLSDARTPPPERRKSAPDSSQFEFVNTETEPIFKENNKSLTRKHAIKRPHSLNPGMKIEKLPLRRLTDMNSELTNPVSKDYANSEMCNNKVIASSSQEKQRKIGFLDKSRKPHLGTFEATKVIERNKVNENIRQYEKLHGKILPERNTSLFHGNIDRFERFLSKCRHSTHERSSSRSVSDLRNIFESLSVSSKHPSRTDKSSKISY